MTRPRVLLDCDGVLSRFMDGALALINDLLGTGYVIDDVTEFDFSRALGLRPDVAAAVKRRIGQAPGFAAELEIYPGAVDGVRRLREVAEVYIVTSPWNSNPTWCHDREWWLDKHFGIKHAHVLHTSAKHLVRGDVFVDDKTSSCEAWRDAWPGGIAVQWRTPHNRRDAWLGISTGNWDELIGIVERAAKSAEADLSERLLVAAGRAER